MKRRFYTSDTHFFHNNIIKYCSRPFKDTEEMNEALIKNWNDAVGKHDEVWFLGDLCFGPVADMANILRRLNGEKHWILGNHDKVKTVNALAKHFKSFGHYAEVYEGTDLVVMSHYPMQSWNRSHHGSYMFHGHCHGSIKHAAGSKIYDVGVDSLEYRPMTFSEITNRVDVSPKTTYDVFESGKEYLYSV